MWGFLGGNFGGDKWGFLIDRVRIFSQDLLATLVNNNFFVFLSVSRKDTLLLLFVMKIRTNKQNKQRKRITKYLLDKSICSNIRNYINFDSKRNCFITALLYEPCSEQRDTTIMEFNKIGLFGNVLEQWALSSEKMCNLIRF